MDRDRDRDRNRDGYRQRQDRDQQKQRRRQRQRQRRTETETNRDEDGQRQRPTETEVDSVSGTRGGRSQPPRAHETPTKVVAALGPADLTPTTGTTGRGSGGLSADTWGPAVPLSPWPLAADPEAGSSEKTHTAQRRGEHECGNGRASRGGGRGGENHRRKLPQIHGKAVAGAGRIGPGEGGVPLRGAGTHPRDPNAKGSGTQAPWERRWAGGRPRRPPAAPGACP